MASFQCIFLYPYPCLFLFRCERTLYPRELGSFINKTESITTSGNKSKGEGLDAQLEEVNKDSKTWAVGAMSAMEWLTVFRNHDSLLEVSLQIVITFLSV